MRKATLIRRETGDAGTFGTLVTDSGFSCVTGELPWRDNAPNISCIPPGVYDCTWRTSTRHGECYHVEDVPHRTDIEIHTANWVGDATKGMICELKGCIAPGISIGEMDGQKAVMFSLSALQALEMDLNQEQFELTIQNGFELPPYDYA